MYGQLEKSSCPDDHEHKLSADAVEGGSRLKDTMQFPKLFEPTRIGKMEIKNRIVMPPMGTNMGTPDGHVTEEIVCYYRERAKGGVGLIIVETTCVDAPGGQDNRVPVGHRRRQVHPRFEPAGGDHPPARRQDCAAASARRQGNQVIDHRHSTGGSFADSHALWHPGGL